MRFLVRFLGFLFAAGTVVFLVGVAGVAGAIWHFSRDLPDYSQLQDYEPPVMTRVHASDGALLGEYSKERRLYLPIQAMPKLITNAFWHRLDRQIEAPILGILAEDRKSTRLNSSHLGISYAVFFLIKKIKHT